MRKEIIFVVAAGLFVLAYGLDYVAGPVSIVVSDPITFLSTPVVSKYPLTAVAIGIRTLALFTSVALFLSLIDKKYFTKAAITFFLALIAELYAIQQMATGGRMTPVQWTLSFSYTGVFLIPLIGFYILKGIFTGIKEKVSPAKTSAYPKPVFSEESEDEEEKD